MWYRFYTTPVWIVIHTETNIFPERFCIIKPGKTITFVSYSYLKQNFINYLKSI